MKQLDLATAFRFGTSLGHLTSQFNPVVIKLTEGPETIFFPELRDKLKSHYGEIVAFCNDFDLPVSAACGREILELLEGEHTSTAKWLHPPTHELGKRIRAELESRMFLYVPKDNSAFYQKPLDKWDKTIVAYPSATFDVEEASKCLALHRNTACVFHAMRVLELGLKSLASALGLTLDWHERSWGKILNKIKEEIGRRNKSADPAWTPERTFFEDAYSSLHAVKDAWRNTTMHVEKVYDFDRSEHIYRSVRALMEQLTTKLHE